MVLLIMSMGLLNLGVGAMLAMRLGFGPPTLHALWESLGTIPEANEVAESSEEFLEEESAAEPAAEASKSAIATPGAETAKVDGDADLANNPLLEQSVLDEVRALGDALASPGDASLSAGA